MSLSARIPLSLVDKPARLGYRPALDGLRGVAILLVVAQHALVPGFARSGSVGVTLFFVLSGFLITTLLLEEQDWHGRISIGAFYVRRARRLLPALAAFLVVMATLSVPAVAIASAALYAANWVQVAGYAIDPLSHTWSLAVEEQFYLVWPVLFVAVGLSRRWLLAGIAVAIGLRIGAWMLTGDRELTFFATATRADAILAGSLLAVTVRARAWQPGPRLVTAAVAALAVASVVPDYGFLAFVGLPAATAGSVVLVGLAASSTPRVLAWPSLVYIGAISYGLYLWHGPLLYWARPTGSAAMIGLGVVAAVAIAALSHRYVERPFLRRKATADNPGESDRPGATSRRERGRQRVGRFLVDPAERTEDRITL